MMTRKLMCRVQDCSTSPTMTMGQRFLLPLIALMGTMSLSLHGHCHASASASASSPRPNQFPIDLECDVYQLAYEFAEKIQPSLSASQKRAVWDALGVDTLCHKNATRIPAPPVVPRGSASAAFHAPTYGEAPGSTSIYVDAIRGKDSNSGSLSAPLRTLATAQLRARSTPGPSTIQLRQGVYYLQQTLALTEADSHVTIQNYNGEEAEISGATPLENLAWKAHDVASGKNIWVASVPKSTFTESGGGTMTGLRFDGRRGIRSRWPNGDPETQLFPDGWANDGFWAPPRTFSSAPEDIVVTSPNRSTEGPCESVSGYCNYVTGIGGACADYGYSPPSGYWCNSNPPRGKEFSTSFPAALTYNSSAFDGKSWTSFVPNRTVINAFRSGHWFSYVFLVDQYDSSSKRMSWTVGGFQGGEGCNTAAEWNVENVFEELDSPNEWFYDEDGEQLYWFYNDTGAPPRGLRMEATQLRELVTVKGAGSARGDTGEHAVQITLRGLKFTGAALSYLEPHGLPSDGGGDWALARSAAIVIEGTEDVQIQGCLFERLDGNAVLLSGYNRRTVIQSNEFHWIGENGVISWGYTADFENSTRAVPIPTGQGPDATDGNHPQGTVLDKNFFHEIGHFQKQVSCYFQAQTQQSTHTSNICFNGPRAGYNFNDGLGGGNLLDSNLIFNMVRETADHGTFNSWDRQPFLYLDETSGKPTYVPQYNEIRHNFWMNNFNPQEATDNDDGSCYYNTHHNFFPFSVGGLKSDFGGHNNHHHSNVYINGGETSWGGITCMGVCGQKKGHEDAFYNNSCILINGSNYASFDQSAYGSVFPIMHNNQVFTTNGTATETGSGGELHSIEGWQKRGHDLGTTVSTIPSNEKIIELAKGVLGM